MLTDERKKELRALADAATPGPWMHVESDGRRNQAVKPVQYEEERVETEYSTPLFHMWAWKPGGRRDARPNAKFIAAARTAVPEMLDHIEELEGEISRLRSSYLTTWRCFHCGFVASTKEEAAAHFGEHGDGDPALCVSFYNLPEGDRLDFIQSMIEERDAARAQVEDLEAKIERQRLRYIELTEELKSCNSDYKDLEYRMKRLKGSLD